jgi:hypothetical protein
MLQDASSRKRRRSLLLWGAIIISAGAAVAFGFAGYAEYNSTLLGDACRPPSLHA